MTSTLNVLVLGKGGREHALAWAIARDIGEDRVFLHPGNAGTTEFESLGSAVAWDRADALLPAIAERRIGLVVIGPEILLAAGLADALRAEGVPVVGPSQTAAQLETSKAFAKDFMVRAGIPTAHSALAGSRDELIALAQPFPVVLKLDGLAAGKGVVIAQTPSDVVEFADRIWTDKEFGESSQRVLVETFLAGRELSYIGLCDGNRFYPLSSSSDYKRIGEGDQGPNTGGMGAISPSPFATLAVEKAIQEKIIAPLLRELNKSRLEYRGALYVGVMVTDAGEPYVLEFNTRFGDPETQALVLRMTGGFTQALWLTSQAKLSQAEITWTEDHSVFAVGAAEGYPGHPRTGDRIDGLSHLAEDKVRVFFSGVERSGDGLVTSGGRVLGIGATGNDLADARQKVYEGWRRVNWKGRTVRRDIGVLSDSENTSG